MKKKCLIKKKMGGIMLLTFLFMVGFILSANANSYSQTTRLDIKLKNLAITDVIKFVEENSEFVFLYKNEDLDFEKKVNIELKYLGAQTSNICIIRLKAD